MTSRSSIFSWSTASSPVFELETLQSNEIEYVTNSCYTLLTETTCCQYQLPLVWNIFRAEILISHWIRQPDTSFPHLTEYVWIQQGPLYAWHGTPCAISQTNSPSGHADTSCGVHSNHIMYRKGRWPYYYGSSRVRGPRHIFDLTMRFATISYWKICHTDNR